MFHAQKLKSFYSGGTEIPRVESRGTILFLQALFFLLEEDSALKSPTIVELLSPLISI